MLKPTAKPSDSAIGHPMPRGLRGNGGDGLMTTASIRNAGNMMVLLTIASVILSTVIRVKFLSPVLHVGAIFPFFYTAVRQHRHSVALALVVRWAIVLFCMVICLGVFVPARMGSSLLFAGNSADVLASWLTSNDAPTPADFPYLLWGVTAFLVGSIISGGLVGLILGSIALGGAAYGALFLFEHGINVVLIAVVSVPLWQWSLFACGVFCIVPASLPFYERLQKIERVAEERASLFKYMYIAAGLFVVTLLLRLTTAGVWRGLLERWTTF